MSPAIKVILVPTDFSETAGCALRYASDVALRIGASLRVLYTDPFLPPIDYSATVGGWNEESFHDLKARAEQQLAHEAALIDPLVLYDAVVRVATALPGILAEADESRADLIIMGTHGRSGVRRLLLGSVTEAVMRGAAVPVLAVPPHAWEGAMTTVLCPVVNTVECFDVMRLAGVLAPADARFIFAREAASDDVSQVAADVVELRSWLPEELVTRCDLKVLQRDHVADQVNELALQMHAGLIVAAEPTDRSFADVVSGTFAARLLQQGRSPVLSMNGSAAHRRAGRRKEAFAASPSAP